MLDANSARRFTSEARDRIRKTYDGLNRERVTTQARAAFGSLRDGHFLAWLMTATPPKRWIYAYLGVMCTLYIFVYVNAPLTLYATAPHDDGLFVKIGRHLANGEYLGPFDQMTLAKGPGYPLFLAVANWFRMPLTWAHALFHCAAVVFSVVVFHRLIRSFLLSALLFALLLWHPIFFIEQRVIRDVIYRDQVLIFVSAFSVLLLAPPEGRRRLWLGVVAGLALGWLWLTREEGAWLLPGIAVIVGAAGLHAWSSGSFRPLASSLMMTVAMFAATQVAFRGANWWAYGKFVGVDVKERNFVRAQGAIHSVVSAGTRPFVSVTREARQKIYAVSPSFASLAPSLDIPPERGWSAVTCRAVPALCGEIGSGWFMWAMRDAAAYNGHYESPAKASSFFGKLADEIEDACRRGALGCEPQLISEMPPVTWSQIFDMPRYYRQAWHWVLLLQPPLGMNPSTGFEESRNAALSFLSYPAVQNSIDAPVESKEFTLQGWYHKKGSEWLWASVRDASGRPVALRFDRRPSPDLRKNDPKSISQRFKLVVRCNEDCILRLQAPGGAKAKRKFSELVGRAHFTIPVGEGKFRVEEVETATLSPLGSSESHGAWLREAALLKYQYALVPTLLLGLFAFLGATFLAVRDRSVSAAYVASIACLCLVFSRVSLIALISATSFFAILPNYLGPASVLLVCAAVLAIAAFWNVLPAVRGARRT